MQFRTSGNGRGMCRRSCRRGLKEDDNWAKNPLLAAGTAAGCGTLPDVLEPALHPNHRLFFHSFLFATGVGFGLYKLYQWKPESEGGELVRAVVLIGGCAY